MTKLVLTPESDLNRVFFEISNSAEPLTELHINGINLPENGQVMLGLREVLNYNRQTLHTIKINNTDLNSNRLSEFAKQLKYHECLEVLDFSNNMIGSAALIDEIIRGLSRNIKVVNLSGNKELLNDQYYLDQFMGCFSCSKLEVLDLSYCGTNISRILSGRPLSSILPQTLLRLDLSGVVDSSNVLPLLTQLNYALRSDKLNPNLHIILNKCDISLFQEEVKGFMEKHPGLIVFEDLPGAIEVNSASAAASAAHESIVDDNHLPASDTDDASYANLLGFHTPHEATT